VWVFTINGGVVHWNGSGWFVRSPPAPTGNVNSYSVTAANDVWATSTGNGAVLHWNGASWQTTSTGIGLASIDYGGVSVTDGWGRVHAVSGSLFNNQPFFLSREP